MPSLKNQHVTQKESTCALKEKNQNSNPWNLECNAITCNVELKGTYVSAVG